LCSSEEPRFDSLQGHDVFLPPQRPDGLWGAFSLLWVPGALFPGFKRPRREAGLSHLVPRFKMRADISPLPTGTNLPFSKYYCDQMTKVEMGRACTTHGKKKKRPSYPSNRPWRPLRL
jgi:hypothetical protein